MSARKDQIKNWLTKQFGELEYFDVASSDASFRGYFRLSFSSYKKNKLTDQLTPETSYIVMDAPPEYEDIQPFINIASFLEQQGINVPHIYAINEQEGFLLLEDLGSKNYLDNLNQDNAQTLYQQAIAVLIKFQSLKAEQLIKLPNYDNKLLNNEMDLFEQWYVRLQLKQSLSQSQQSTLKQTLSYLTEQILLQPTAFVHRDFHSRNLMLMDKNNPGIIDFQDAVIGPCSYDLVSLLRDSYIAWPEHQVQQWVNHYYQQLISKKLITDCTFETFMQWFDFMGMQRQIKVLGIFARLYHRDGKVNYLKDIPQTLNYLMATCQKYPQFNEFYQLLKILHNG